jgi:probable rRNA maturation factor
MADSHFSIINKTRSTPTPVGVPFVSIKEAILGQEYDLSVSILTPVLQKKINTTYREKPTTTNILSFTLSENSGEITFDLGKVKKDAPLFKMTYKKFVTFLFIHGCLHLKGWQHSSTMEKEEKKYLRKFS